ncbi:dihydroorotate dehydrogenase [Thauera sp.]|jgi:dihydroorotate dehydrogenase|uniref:dihydroorotate dehydrogenase n=1 Tax=Thauera sp. TaxID=1905334 RepID=UPI002A361AD7|nr:dihydroorotate dehydrogenase [Thauera sp.]MDX9884270.1 dihydroorotate dehydrogenase [Thauera sp.]
MIPPLTPRALRTRWSVQRLARCASATGAPAAASPAVVPLTQVSSPAAVRPTAVRPASSARAASADSSLTARAVEAMGLRFPSPLIVAAGFDRRGSLLAHAAALGLGGVETGSHRAHSTDAPPLLAVSAWRHGDAPHRTTSPLRPRHGLSLAVPTHTTDVQRRSQHLCRALAAWQAGADYVVLNPGRSGASPAQCVELLAALAELRDRLPRPRRLALVAKLPPAWMEREAVGDWAQRLVAAGADGLLVSADAAPQQAVARLTALAEAVGPRVCLISVGGIDSAHVAKARLAAGARLVQAHRALLGPLPRVMSLIGALA